MKKFIWISLMSLLVFSCGSRTKQIDRSLTERKETIKSEETSLKQTEKQSEIQLQVNEQKSEISQEKTVKNETVTIDTENNSQKSNTENNNKLLKKVTYYPNGQKKSETELSENFSKVSEEKEMYKNKYNETLAKLDESIKQQNSIYSQNLDLTDRLNESVTINKELLSESENKDLQIKKLTDRKGISFGGIIWIVIISMIVGFFLISWLKSYLPKWRINLFNKK